MHHPLTTHHPPKEQAIVTPVVKIAGDGIGPEVMAATDAVLHAAGAHIDWIDAAAGLGAVERFGDPLPDTTLDLIRKHRVALKGPCTTPIGKGYRSINVRLRQELDLYASVRPVPHFAGLHGAVPGRRPRRRPREHRGAVFRPGTRGGAGRHRKPALNHEGGLRTHCTFRFRAGPPSRAAKVTFCHKADVLPLSDGLFLATARYVADDYPFLGFDEMKIDHVCLELALDPTKFDVLVMENLFGDVISDLCAGLVGGLGLVPGANIGTKVAVFEAVHGSAGPGGKGAGQPDRPVALGGDAAAAHRPARCLGPRGKSG